MEPSFLLAFFICLTSVAAQASTWKFNYAKKGYDFHKAIPPDGWTGVNHCGEPENQAPISLLSPLGLYGWAYGEALPHELERLETNFLNPKPGSRIVYKNLNHELLLNEPDPKYGPDAKSYYKTDFASSIYGASITGFTPNSFHLHHPSEFPIDGSRNDISLHMVLYPLEKARSDMDFKALALGIQFSVDNFDRDISEEETLEVTNFFDTLDFRNINSQIEGLDLNIPLREFMDAVDLSEKWMLDGSGALPPCLKRVAWQITRKIYPIELQHKLIVQKVQELHKHELRSLTNIRGIFPVNGHEVRFVGALFNLGGSLALVVGSAVASILL